MASCTLNNYIRTKTLDNVSQWVKDCISGHRTNVDQKSAWSWGQLVSERAFLNMDIGEFERNLVLYNNFNRTASITPLKYFYDYCYSSNCILPDIDYKKQKRDPKYVYTFMRLDKFIEMIEYAKEIRNCNVEINEVFDNENDLIDKLSGKKNPFLFSKELKDIKASIGVGRKGQGNFWITNLPRKRVPSFKTLPPAELNDLLQSAGLLYNKFSESTHKKSILIRILFDKLKKPKIPTVFHAKNSYFVPNRKASQNWGRTLNKNTRNPDDGFPELIHEPVLWDEDCLAIFIGQIAFPLEPLNNDQWNDVFTNCLCLRGL